MTKTEAEKLITRVCRGELGLGFTGHFWDRAGERTPGFQKQHVYNVLRTGKVQGTPVFDEKHNNHKVKVRASLPDFGRVELVLAVSWFDDTVCITIYEKT
jgi:hypothetical protein